MKFNRFYAAAPVCSPTRGSCLTGRHPSRYGIDYANTGHLPKQEIVLPELLKNEGYATGHFGKWHVGTVTHKVRDSNRGKPGDKTHYSPPQWHGYDRCFVTEAKVPTYDPMIKPKKANGKAWDPVKNKSDAQVYGTRYWNEKGEEVKDGLDGDDSRIIMDRAIPFIESSVAAKKPFFASIWFHAPHLPVVAGSPHVDAYKDRSVYERNYFGCVTALDAEVGRLRDALKKLGVAEDTMVWFCSDNGPEGQEGKAPGSAGPFRGRKRSLYEGGVRVPAILEWPAVVKAGTSTDFPAVTSDYLPTIVELLGLQIPKERPIDGTSLIQAITGDSGAKREKGIGFVSRKQVAYHLENWKVISNDNGKTWELYDLSKDPSEKNDLREKYSEKTRQMAAIYEEWRKSCLKSRAGEDYRE